MWKRLTRGYFDRAAILCALMLMFSFARAQDNRPDIKPARQDSPQQSGRLEAGKGEDVRPGSSLLKTGKQTTGPETGGERSNANRDAKTGASLTIHFTGLRGRRGVLRVVLVDKPAAWMSKKVEALDRRNIVLKDLDTTAPLEPLDVTFDGLASGTYAVSAYHDANSNNRLDTNLLGIPTERTGASNNPRPAMRAPRFNEAKFDLQTDEKKVLAITLR